jgi:hypothetical protein
LDNVIGNPKKGKGGETKERAIKLMLMESVPNVSITAPRLNKLQELGFVLM